MGKPKLTEAEKRRRKAQRQADDRNPGSVTMTDLFLEWMRDER